jgi:hypothetical protein
VPLVGTPVDDGGATGRAAVPEREYSQTSPPSAATGFALGAEDSTDAVPGELGAGGDTGIWPQLVSSAALPMIKIAVARWMRIFELLAHRYRARGWITL